MKKAKWAAMILGIPVVCVGILWVDSYQRAVAAIKAEDERLAKDIAAYRAGKKPGLGVEREQFRLGWFEGDVRVEVRRRPLPCPMDRLNDLVPPYLPRVAQGLTLLNGNLSIPLTQDQVCTWDVRRK